MFVMEQYQAVGSTFRADDDVLMCDRGASSRPEACVDMHANLSATN